MPAVGARAARISRALPIPGTIAPRCAMHTHYIPNHTESTYGYSCVKHVQLSQCPCTEGDDMAVGVPCGYYSCGLAYRRARHKYGGSRVGSKHSSDKQARPADTRDTHMVIQPCQRASRQVICIRELTGCTKYKACRIQHCHTHDRIQQTIKALVPLACSKVVYDETKCTTHCYHRIANERHTENLSAMALQ